jgi:hypothetical protein
LLSTLLLIAAPGQLKRYLPRVMKRTRVIAAFLLSPFAGALYLLVLTFLFDDPVPTHIEELVAMVVFLALIGFVAEIALGIPLLLFFRYFRLMKLQWFLLGGLLIGVAVFGFLGRPSYQIRWGFVYCVAPAMISTAAFWFLGWSADNKSLDRSADSLFLNLID